MSLGSECLLIGGAPLVPDADYFYRNHLETAEIIVAVDAGCQLCKKFDVIPDLIVGDMDSVDVATLEWGRKSGAELLEYPSSKDETDLELALGWCEGQGFSHVSITAVVGGRLDHQFGVMASAMLPWSFRTTILEPELSVWFIHAPGCLYLSGNGATVSIFAWSSTARIKTEGFEYPLKHETPLPRLVSLGVSNKIVASRAAVAVAEGSAIIMAPRLDDGGAMEYSDSNVRT